MLRFSLLLLVALSMPASAQSGATKPIRVISQFGAGASGDLASRIVTASMAGLLGQPVVVENRPGGTGLVAAEPVARAAPDGYTLLVSSPSLMVRWAAGLRSTVDPVRDLTPITPVGDNPTAIFVSASLPFNTLKDLIDYANVNPGKLAYGTSGIGSKSHLAAESLQQLTGAKLLHVPYKNGNQALLDVVAGQLLVSLSLSDLGLPYMRSGKVKALALLGERSGSVPGVPAVAETVPAFVAPPSWVGFSGPAGLPQPVLRRLSETLIKAIRTPEATAKLDSINYDIWAYTPEQFAAMVKRDLELVTKIIKDSQIKLED